MQEPRDHEQPAALQPPQAEEVDTGLIDEPAITAPSDYVSVNEAAEPADPPPQRELRVDREATEVSGPTEQLYALHMPSPTTEQLKALGALAAAFGWELIPVAEEERVSHESPDEAVRAVHDASRLPEIDEESALYLEKYAAAAAFLENVGSLRVDNRVRRKPFTASEIAAFKAEGLRSVTELTSLMGRHRVVVYQYELAPSLPAFKVEHVQSKDGHPDTLCTYVLGVSGGSFTFQTYTKKILGVTLNPPKDIYPVPMDIYWFGHLEHNVIKPNMERVVNGRWTNDD